jgi:hypothetical protein
VTINSSSWQQHGSVSGSLNHNSGPKHVGMMFVIAAPETASHVSSVFRQ